MYVQGYLQGSENGRVVTIVWPDWFKPKMYHTQGEHAIHYTTGGCIWNEHHTQVYPYNVFSVS
jgi:hypothetical protein